MVHLININLKTKNMRTQLEVTKKIESKMEEVENLKALKDAAISTKQYSVAKECNSKLSIMRRDLFILNWFLEDSE